MSITFNNPISPSTPGNGGKKPKVLPIDTVKERKKEQLKHQQMQIKQKLDRLQMAGKIASRFIVTAAPADPNRDPNDLFQQIRPLLSKLQIANMCQGNKTKLIVGKSRGNESLYCVLFRRTAQIDTNHIERLKRENKQLEYLIWTNDGIEIYLWWTYEAPAQKVLPGIPS